MGKLENRMKLVNGWVRNRREFIIAKAQRIMTLQVSKFHFIFHDRCGDWTAVMNGWFLWMKQRRPHRRRNRNKTMNEWKPLRAISCDLIQLQATFVSIRFPFQFQVQVTIFNIIHSTLSWNLSFPPPHFSFITNRLSNWFAVKCKLHLKCCGNFHSRHSFRDYGNNNNKKAISWMKS